MILPKRVMVFDCESLGVYGQGVAVGWVIGEVTGRGPKLFIRWLEKGCLQSRYIAYHERGEFVPQDAKPWFDANVLPALKDVKRVESLCNHFGKVLARERKLGTTFWAECGHPVESNFLQFVLSADESLYPLHEIATVMLLAGMDPMALYDRQIGEVPKHNPLADAKQSMRLLEMALRKLSK